MIFVTDPPYTTYSGSLQRESLSLIEPLSFICCRRGYFTSAIEDGYYLDKQVDGFTTILKQ